jgi:hypothetical protein
MRDNSIDETSCQNRNVEEMKRILNEGGSIYISNVYQIYVIGALCFCVFEMCLIGSYYLQLSREIRFAIACIAIIIPVIIIKIQNKSLDFNDFYTNNIKCIINSIDINGKRNNIYYLKIAFIIFIMFMTINVLVEIAAKIIVYGNINDISIINLIKVLQGINLTIYLCIIYSEYKEYKDNKYCHASKIFILNLNLGLFVMIIFPYIMIPFISRKDIEYKSTIFVTSIVKGGYEYKEDTNKLITVFDNFTCKPGDAIQNISCLSIKKTRANIYELELKSNLVDNNSNDIYSFHISKLDSILKYIRDETNMHIFLVKKAKPQLPTIKPMPYLGYIRGFPPVILSIIGMGFCLMLNLLHSKNRLCLLQVSNYISEIENQGNMAK